jgi:hypothetical protein
LISSKTVKVIVFVAKEIINKNNKVTKLLSETRACKVNMESGGMIKEFSGG